MKCFKPIWLTMLVASGLAGCATVDDETRLKGETHRAVESYRGYFDREDLAQEERFNRKQEAVRQTRPR